VSALGLSAVGGTRVVARVASSANQLVLVELAGENDEGRLNDTSSQTQDQVKGGFLLDVVVAECAAVFQLFSSKDQTLLIWRDSFFVLNLLLDIVDGVRGFNLEGDCRSCEGLYEDLHGKDNHPRG